MSPEEHRTLSDDEVARIAARHEQARMTVTPMRRVTLDHPHMTLDDAYACQAAWVDVREAAGFPGLRLHDLRHSIRSALVTIGTPLPPVAKMLGNRSLNATARYAHASDSAALATAAALSDHLDSAELAESVEVVPIDGGR